MSETKIRRPFHETIVEAVHKASDEQMECLAEIIKTTKIPKGHDEIAAAWSQRRSELNWGEDKSLGVRVNLLEQKQEAVEKELEKANKEEVKTTSS